MGFNFQGIAISKPFNTAEALADELGIGDIEKIGDTDFEYATLSSIGDNDVFITPLSGGTIITLGVDFDIQDINLVTASNPGKALKFMLSETTMSFAFEYFENGEHLRTVLHAEETNIAEEGDPLAIETTETDLTEIIFSLISDITGEEFYGIEPDQRSEHFKKV